MERFKASEARKISNFLGKDVFPAVRTKIEAAIARGASPARLKQLSAAIDSVMKAGMVRAGKKTVSSLTDLSVFEAEWAAGTLSKTIPLDIEMSMPSLETLRQLVTTNPMEGHKLATWLEGYSTAAKTKMMKQIKVGVAMGESLPAIGKRMRNVISLKRKQAEYIARTAVSSVVHNAREEVYKQNPNIIKNYQWVATLDTRTTLICINLDGQVFPVGKGPKPPAHFNCRSTTVPIVVGWGELGIEAPPPGTRASMNGAVPDKVTYKDWFRKQTKATQIKVLGPARYELYKGGLPLRGFVAADYSPMTLAQMQIAESFASPELKAARAELAGLRKQSLAIKDEMKVISDRNPKYRSDPGWIALRNKRRGVKAQGDIVRERIKELKGTEPKLPTVDWTKVEPSLGGVPPSVPTGNTKYATAAEYRQKILAAGGETPAYRKKMEKLMAEKRVLYNEHAAAGDAVAKQWNIDFKGSKYARLRDEMDEVYKRLAAKQAEIFKLQAKTDVSKAKLRKILKEKDNITGAILQTRDKYDVKVMFGRKSFQKVAGDITDMIPAGRLQKSQLKNVDDLYTTMTSKTRSSAYGGCLGQYFKHNKRIEMFCGRNDVFAHEFGHHLSDWVYDIEKRQNTFFNARTKGESVTRFWGNIRGKKDKWDSVNLYAGRVYPNGIHPEVIAVGIENLWNNPLNFAKRDPEWFDMVVGALKGL
jgi:SPP1 gp7 family putative phage head morphogenesis protein